MITEVKRRITMAASSALILIGPLLGGAVLVAEPQKKVELPTAEQPAETAPANPAKVYVDPVSGAEVTGPAVVMLSLPGCGPCETWWASRRQPLVNQRWQVKRASGPFDGVPRYPSFRVFDGNVWHTSIGPLTFPRLRAILSPRVSVVRQPVAVRATSGWTIAGQAWTRQSLIDHLATHSNHHHSRASLNAMTLSQLDAIHTADHEGRRVASSVAASCPTCPQASRRTARRF